MIKFFPFWLAGTICPNVFPRSQSPADICHHCSCSSSLDRISRYLSGSCQKLHDRSKFKHPEKPCFLLDLNRAESVTLVLIIPKSQ